VTGPPRLAEEGAQQLLRRLDLLVSRRLDGLLHGQHQGLSPGTGSEPGDARVYQPGDDVRHIDWAVTARSADPHVRMPVAERELETWIVVDLSPSLDFGTASCEKRDLAVAALAAVGFLTASSGNRVGGLLVHATGTSRVPARGGRAHLHALLHRAITADREEGGGTTDLAGALREAARLAGRRGLVVVVSDFLGAPGWERPLRALAARHDVLGIEVLDPRELELPDVGVLTFTDPETGAHLEVQTSDRGLRARYAEAASAQRAAIAAALRGAGADHLQLRTDRDWLQDLVAFVDRRRHRLRTPAPPR
jgi:uncharacterized protein (DUF58 family)